MRKQRIKRTIKIACIVVIIAMLLCLMLKIMDIFILNKITKKVVSSFRANENHKIEYNMKFNFLKSHISMQNVKIEVKTGVVNVGEIIIKKRNGFILPSKISVIPKAISSVPVNGRKYDILSKTGEVELIVMLNKHLLNLPTFCGIKIKHPAEFVFLEKQNEIGKIGIERMSFLMRNNVSFTDYKGNMIFHDSDFIPYVILLDKPFKWEIKTIERKTTKKSKLYSESGLEVVNDLTIEKMYLDLDFSTLSVRGKSKYSTQLYQTDLAVEITNDNKLIDAVFNMILQTRGEDGIHTIEKAYKKMKNEILPLLRKQDNKSTENKLFLSFKKTENDDDTYVNGVAMTNLVTKLVQ